MKLLVIGRSGQLACALAATAQPDVEIETIGRPDVDLCDARSVAAAVARAKADIVVNAAAYTAVDKAETETEMARTVNATGPELLAKACAQSGIALIHVSTDYVFDGTKAGAYAETDPVAPIKVYGATKLEGEQRIAAFCPQHLIFRTSWVHSPWGANFVKTMLRLAATRSTVNVVDDQSGAPTYAPHLATAILAAARRAVTTREAMAWGIYHAVNRGETSWCGFARKIFELAAPLGLPTAQAMPITTAGFPTPARRPANSRLSSDRLASQLGISLPSWQEGVTECVAQLAAQGRSP